MKRLALVLCVLWLAPASFAQTGYPLYGSFQRGPIDSVNLQNLNSVISIPVLGTPGRGGTNFALGLRYNSLDWIVSGNAWQPAPYGGWVQNPLFGSVTHAVTGTNGNCGRCIQGEGCQGYKQITTWKTYAYVDPAGTPHSFNVYVTDTYNSCTDSDTFVGIWAGYSSDGLYWIDLGPTDSDPTQMVVWSTQTGTKMDLTTPGYVTVTDRNGNQITQRPGTGESDWTDTAGHKVMWQIQNGSNVEYHYYGPDGSDQKFVLKYQNYSVMTNFNCGALEYNSSGTMPQWSLPYELDLPNGRSYTFTYEGTPGHSGYVTGRISEVTLPTGGSYTYTYGGSNDGVSCSIGNNIINLTRQISDGTNTATWQYTSTPSGSNYATTVTAPQMPYDSAANQSVYTFNSSGQQITEQDYQGSSSGTLQKTVNSTWAANGSPSTAVTVLPNNQQSEVATTYDSHGHLDQMVEYDWGQGAVGNKIRTTNLAYTTINAPVSFLVLSDKQVLDSGGSVASREDIAYDGNTLSGCPTGVAQHDDTNYACSYNTRGNATSVTTYAMPATQGGAITRSHTYDFFGNVLTTALNGNQQQQFSFSPTTNYAYPGSVVSAGLTETFTYNAYTGQVVSDKDPNNATTAYAYDTMKRLTTVTRADNVQLTTTYSDTSSPTLTNKTPIDSSGDAVQIVTGYDGLGRAVSATTEDASGTTKSEVQTVYDPVGRVYKTSSPYTGSPSYYAVTQFDALGRPTSATDAGGGTASFSYTGNDIYQTVGPAPSGENPKRRQSEYNEAGMLTSVCEMTSLSGSGTCSQTASATGYWTEYSHDALGDLTGVTQNAQSGSQDQTRAFTYDGLGRMTSQTNPETGNNSVYYFYDSDPGTRGGANCSGTYAGDLVKKVDAAGNVTCYSYDVRGRNLSVTYPYGPNSSNTSSRYFVYDSATVNSVAMANAAGRMAEAYTCVSPCSSKVTDEGFSYTVLGQVQDVYESTPHSGGYFHVDETYWGNGAVDQVSGLSGLPTLTYGVDAIGRSASVSASSGQNPVTGTSYNVANEVTALNLGSGDSDSFTYDSAMFRMTQYQSNVNGQSVTGALTWNANGSLGKLAITDAFNSANTQTCTYGHDDLARIASGNCGSVWSQTFSYDAFGNITKTGSNQFQPGYNWQTNQMSSGASYDSNGDVLNDSLHSYAWNVETRPTTIDTVTVTYDALGRMVEQGKSGSNTEIVYGPTGNKLALMNGMSTMVKGFALLPGGAAAVYNGSGLQYYRHPDWLGSGRFASTPSRTMYNDLAYAPFGEQYAQAGSTGVTDTSFGGNNQDTTTNLYDAMYRGYGIQGRWPSPDPLGVGAVNPANPQTWNRYAYVRNNPLLLTDSSGTRGCYTVEAVPGDTSQQTSGYGPYDASDEMYAPLEGGGGEGCGGFDSPFGGGSGEDVIGIDGGFGLASLCTDAGCVQCPNNDCGFGSPGGEYRCDAAGTCAYYNSSPGTDPDLSAAVSNCVSSQYGIMMTSFSASQPGKNGSFSALAAPGTINNGNAYSTFTVTNDSSTYTLNQMQAVVPPYQNPNGQEEETAGFTDSANPYVNYTASDLTLAGTVFVQQVELGNSLTMITHSMPLSQMQAMDQAGSPPGQALATCTVPHQ